MSILRTRVRSHPRLIGAPGSGYSRTNMSGPKYRTVPASIKGMPPGIPYIVVNEAAERYSYYGMRAILVLFMTQHLRGADGQLATMSDAAAKESYHLFAAAVYATPIFGTLIADGLLGKYRTILSLSLVYCAGHFALAVDETRVGLLIGLGLIAVGAGGIKPCVSAHVGDQFGPANRERIPRVFAWFYFAINAGALLSTLFAEVLLDRFGPSVAFGVPGALMLLATFVFWLGRHHFVHVPPAGAAFVRDVFSREGLGALGRLFVLYVFIAMFWSLYDQTASAWVLQAEHMDRHFIVDWGPSQIQAINPLLILLFIPLFSYVIYPAVARLVEPTPLRRIGAGLFLTVVAFLVPAWIEARLGAGVRVNIAWQLVAYVLMTAAEILVSITALELSYTQAPRRMKSFVMGAFFLSITVGNLFTSAVNFFIVNPDGSSKLPGAEYYLFFAGAMLIAAVLYVPAAVWFEPRAYIQGESDGGAPLDDAVAAGAPGGAS